MKTRLFPLTAALALSALLPCTPYCPAAPVPEYAVYAAESSGTVGGLCFVSDGESVSITACDRSLTKVSVPTTINGLPVTTIAEQAFAYCTDLTAVSLPYTITTIEDWAFISCTSLKQINLPSHLTSIGRFSFASCTSLTTITVPDTLTTITEDAFIACTALQNLTLPATLTTIDTSAFSGCDALQNVHFQGTKAQWAGVQIADQNAPLQGAVMYYEGNAVGESVYSGMDCSHAKGSVTIAGFDQSITEITIPSAIQGSAVTAIGEGAFQGCQDLTAVTLPPTLTDIQENAFYGCTSLTNIVLPADLTTLGCTAFRGCTSLKTVELQGSVEVIDTGTFEACAGLEHIVLPNGCTTIGIAAFNGCTSLTRITIPNSVETIDFGAFLGTAITDVYFTGTAAEWDAIRIGEFNDVLQTAVIHYNADPLETTPPTLHTGDTTADGSINIADVIFLNRAILGDVTMADNQQTAADVNADGTVDSSDSLLILKYIVELIASF